MTPAQSKTCPNCDKWLINSQDICPDCGAPANLFEKEIPKNENESGQKRKNTINFKAGQLIVLIALWVIFFPAIIVYAFMFTTLKDELKLVHIMAIFFPLLFIFILYRSTRSYIKYRIQQKNQKDK